MINFTHAIKVTVDFMLRTNLLLRSGSAGDFTDSTIEKTPNKNCLHVNGYVWSSILRRAMDRLKGYEKITASIGKYDYPEERGKYDYPEERGVSPFWFESSLVPLPNTDVRPGIKIDRKHGVNVIGALFNDEIVPPGLPLKMRFTCFCGASDMERIKAAVQTALWVVHDGIENIGGGWSYGYGRLEVTGLREKTLDLREKDKRKLLWVDEEKGYSELLILKPADSEILRQWKKISVKARVSDGQLLGIHSPHPLSADYAGINHLPDTFAFRRYRFNPAGTLEPEYAVPGKAIRQGIFSVPIERKLRTKGEAICETPAEYCTCPDCIDYRKETGNKGRNPNCKCKCMRCAWFGSTESGGIIAVTDGVFTDLTKTGKPETVVLNRQQLCEHSMQNIQLFSGEYLKQGIFTFEIYIDIANSESSPDLQREVISILEEAKGNNSPPGWHRIGGTSTCTGQVSVIEY